MKNTKEVKPDNTTLFDEIVYLAQTVKEVKQYIKDKDIENNELKKDSQAIATELYISELCHQHHFYSTGKQLIKFILQGNSKVMIDKKFDLLLELVGVYQKIAGLVGEIKKEEKGEK